MLHHQHKPVVNDVKFSTLAGRAERAAIHLLAENDISSIFRNVKPRVISKYINCIVAKLLLSSVLYTINELGIFALWKCYRYISSNEERNNVASKPEK